MLKLMLLPDSHIRILAAITLLLLGFDVHGQTEVKNVYLFDDFQDATIVTGSGNRLDSQINYHTLYEQMYLLKNDYRIPLDEKIKIDSVRIGERLFLPYEKAFFELLLNDDVALFRQHRSKLSETGMNIGYDQTTKTTSNNTINFTQNPNYISSDGIPAGYVLVNASQFWIRYKEKLHAFYTAKQLVNLFTELKDDLKDQLKLPKTDFSQDEEVVKIIEFINTKI